MKQTKSSRGEDLNEARDAEIKWQKPEQIEDIDKEGYRARSSYWYKSGIAVPVGP
jgi:hypothetical protein